MTIPATPRRSPVYVGNGIATDYAFTFKVTDPATLVVTVADANDLNSQVLVNGVDYTVTLNGDQNASPGGSISYASLPVGHRLVITSDTDSSQPTAISNLGAFHANVLEGALDRIVILHQQQQEQLDRCVKVVPTSEQDPSTLFDSALTLASNSANAAAASASAAQTARTGAEAALDAFDDRYLGAKASDPTTDNDGNPLIDGALYWNTANKRMRIYSLATTSWGPFPATGADVAVTPAGNIAASDVQAALEELDTEKVAKSGDTMTGPLTVPMVVTDSPLSFRNLVINGDFRVNQRGYTSGSAVGAANTYTLDRWRVVTSGQSVSWTAYGNGKQITAPAGGVEQVIEGANIVGGVYTLSWVGAATATVNGSAVANGGQTAALTAGSNCTLRFSGGTVAQVQMEKGSTKTVFEQRPIGLETQLCQRYYEMAGSLSTGMAAYAAGAFSITSTIRFCVPKRASPNFSADVSNMATTAGATCSSGTVTSPVHFSPTADTQQARLIITHSGTAPAGAILQGTVSWEADAEL